MSSVPQITGMWAWCIHILSLISAKFCFFLASIFRSKHSSFNHLGHLLHNVFLDGLLEEAYTTHPLGFEGTEKTMVCKLNKEINGLQQAPHVAFDRPKATSVFYMLVYINDIMVNGNKPSPCPWKLTLSNNLEIFSVFRIEVQVLDDGFQILSQSKHIRDLFAKTTTAEAKPIFSPVVGGSKLSNMVLKQQIYYRTRYWNSKLLQIHYKIQYLNTLHSNSAIWNWIAQNLFSSSHLLWQSLPRDSQTI